MSRHHQSHPRPPHLCQGVAALTTCHEPTCQLAVPAGGEPGAVRVYDAASGSGSVLGELRAHRSPLVGGGGGWEWRALVGTGKGPDRGMASGGLGCPVEELAQHGDGIVLCGSGTRPQPPCPSCDGALGSFLVCSVTALRAHPPRIPPSRPPRQCWPGTTRARCSPQPHKRGRWCGFMPPPRQTPCTPSEGGPRPHASAAWPSPPPQSSRRSCVWPRTMGLCTCSASPPSWSGEWQTLLGGGAGPRAARGVSVQRVRACVSQGAREEYTQRACLQVTNPHLPGGGRAMT